MAYEWRDGPEDYKKPLTFEERSNETMSDRMWHLNQMTSCVVQMGNHPIGSEPYERYRKSYEGHVRDLVKLQGYIMVSEADFQRLQTPPVPQPREHPSWYTKFCEVDAENRRLMVNIQDAEVAARSAREQNQRFMMDIEKLMKDRQIDKDDREALVDQRNKAEKELEALKASRFISKTITLRITGDLSDHKSIKTNLVEIRDR